jgi:hypothetical protein
MDSRRETTLVAVEWPDGQTSSLRFQDCYLLEASMNFGMVAPESILTASEDRDGDVLRTLRENWSKLGMSTIRVYALRWVEELVDGSEER